MARQSVQMKRFPSSQRCLVIFSPCCRARSSSLIWDMVCALLNERYDSGMKNAPQITSLPIFKGALKLSLSCRRRAKPVPVFKPIWSTVSFFDGGQCRFLTAGGVSFEKRAVPEPDSARCHLGPDHGPVPKRSPELAPPVRGFGGDGCLKPSAARFHQQPANQLAALSF